MERAPDIDGRRVIERKRIDVVYACPNCEHCERGSDNGSRNNGAGSHSTGI
jgi:hypothetical protein